METPLIIVFTGTSGSGRKTVAHRVGRELGLTHVVSATTRLPREREISEKDYHYITEEQFAAAERDGRFAQTATIGRHRYGVLTQELEQALGGGRTIYLILNKEGATAIKQLYGERVIRLFLYVDKQTVQERLESKGTRYDVVEQYLQSYTEEVVYRKQCELIIQNSRLEETVRLARAAIAELLAAGRDAAD